MNKWEFCTKFGSFLGVRRCVPGTDHQLRCSILLLTGLRLSYSENQLSPKLGSASVQSWQSPLAEFEERLLKMIPITSNHYAEKRS